MSNDKTWFLPHSRLGTVAGRLIDQEHSDGTKVEKPVVHFRSIPYATIPARFKQSVLLSTIPDAYDGRPKGDFTQYGHACPQVPQPYDTVSGKLPGEEDRNYDEFTCLNLTISAPLSQVQKRSEDRTEKGLPVMVYVHGGALEEGAGHISALNETVKMTDMAEAENTGVVVVSIGYRLNWFGFIACQDLVDEARGESQLGESDLPLFNYGLRDQRNAFLWVKENISGFGGDPDNITAFGESAGAISLSLHLCSDVPLFHRVILQSGSPSCLTNVPTEYHEHRYQKLLEFLSINADTAAARLQALRDTPARRLIDAIAAFAMGGFRPYRGPESQFFPVAPTWANQGSLMANCPWIGDIMIGDSFNEGYVFHDIFKTVCQSKFIANVRRVLGQQRANQILNAYGIDPEGKIDPNLFVAQGMKLAGDVVFSEPTHSISNALVATRPGDSNRRSVYRYSFGLSNPFPGSVLAFVPGHHAVELYYQFMTLTSRYPTYRNKFFERQAQETSRAWTRFGNGLAPFENAEYNLDEGRIAVCDDLRGWRARSRIEDEETSKSDPWGPRRYENWELLAEAYCHQSRLIPGGDVGDIADNIRSQLLAWEGFLKY